VRTYVQSLRLTTGQFVGLFASLFFFSDVIFLFLPFFFPPVRSPEQFSLVLLFWPPPSFWDIVLNLRPSFTPSLLSAGRLLMCPQIFSVLFVSKNSVKISSHPFLLLFVVEAYHNFFSTVGYLGFLVFHPTLAGFSLFCARPPKFFLFTEKWP